MHLFPYKQKCRRPYLYLQGKSPFRVLRIKTAMPQIGARASWLKILPQSPGPIISDICPPRMELIRTKSLWVSHRFTIVLPF